MRDGAALEGGHHLWVRVGGLTEGREVCGTAITRGNGQFNRGAGGSGRPVTGTKGTETQGARKIWEQSSLRITRTQLICRRVCGTTITWGQREVRLWSGRSVGQPSPWDRGPETIGHSMETRGWGRGGRKQYSGSTGE